MPGLRYGIAAITPATAGPDAWRTDTAALAAAVARVAAGPIVFVMAPEQAEAIPANEIRHDVITAAGLRSELSLTSFRHGGFTEAGAAELTDREIMAQGRHKSVKVLPKYVKRTMKQVAAGAQKRRATRVAAG